MRSFGDGLLCDDFAPSRRDVVKYGAATAISAAVIPVHRVLAAENANSRLRSHALGPGTRLACGGRRPNASLVNIRDRHFHRAVDHRGFTDFSAF